MSFSSFLILDKLPNLFESLLKNASNNPFYHLIVIDHFL